MASGFKFSPRCNAADACCVVNCGWFVDDFERAASTALGDQWDEVVGDWELDGSGRLVIDTSDARIKPLYWDGASWVGFGNLSHFYLRAVVSATADGDEILFGSVHSISGEIYTFGLRVGAAAKIWFGESDPAGATLYDCPVTAAANTEHELIFDCGLVYLNGTIVANLIGLLARTSVGGDGFFLGTNDVTGEVRFQEVTIEKTRVSHPASGCPTCPNCPTFLGESPATVTVTVAGHTGRWATLNGVYVLDRIADHDRVGETPCIYELTGLGKLWDVNDDGTAFDDITTITYTPDLVFVEFTGANLFRCSYNYNAATLPCSGADEVNDYDSTAYAGGGVGGDGAQVGVASATVDL